LYEASSRPAPGVVLVHMLARSKEDWSGLAERLQAAGATVLALDLRGHGGSSGSPAALGSMVLDVQAAVDFLAARPGVRPATIALVGASLGASLAALAAAGTPVVRALALVSPALDYRGIRLDAGVMKKMGARPVWLAASAEDPYALRTVRELAPAVGVLEQRVSSLRAHGTALVAGDPDLSAALVDWLRRTLIF
jgi:alpha-beta hydrolase superfamily lysophospholipase